MTESVSLQEPDSTSSAARRRLSLSRGELTVLSVSVGLLLLVAVPSFLRALYELRGRECSSRLELIYSIMVDIARERGTKPGEEICQAFDINVRLDRMKAFIKVGAEPDCPAGGDFTVDFLMGPDGRPIPPKCSLGCWLFGLNDLKDPTGFVTRLRDAMDPLSQYLRERLPDEAKEALDEYKGSGVPGKDLQRLLVAALNEVLEDGCLFDEDRFAGIRLSPEVRSETQADLRGEDLVRLNRLLMEEAYPRAIAKRDPTNGLRGLHRYTPPPSADSIAVTRGGPSP